jgi:hypothetical protein
MNAARLPISDLYYGANDTSQNERSVLFIDILGFAKLVEENPTVLYRDEKHDSDDNVEIRVTPSIKRYSAFQGILDELVSANGLVTDFKAMIFSDCAFVVCGEPSDTAILAVRLMRRFLLCGVPVRMGLGFGTYHHLLSSSESKVTKAVFYGTGIVRSHAAESSGYKGMRVFVHPTVEPHLDSIRAAVDVLELCEANEHAAWELSILNQDEPKSEVLKDALELDRDLWKALRRIRATVQSNADKGVLRQYDCTERALNRMRAKVGRPLF